MRAEPGRDGSGPLAHRCRCELRGELLAEVAGDEVERHGVLVGRQQRRLAQRRRIGAARQGCACLLEPARRIRIGAEIELVEAHDCRLAKRGGIRIEVGLQVRIGRGLLRDGFLEQHVELLPDTALDHRIVTVEAERDALAVQDLVAYVGVHQPVQLDRAGRPVPGALELGNQQVDLGLADDDSMLTVVVGSDATVIQEECETQQQEVQQRFTQDATDWQRCSPTNGRFECRARANGYRLGGREVYLRSCPRNAARLTAVARDTAATSRAGFSGKIAACLTHLGDPHDPSALVGRDPVGLRPGDWRCRQRN